MVRQLPPDKMRLLTPDELIDHEFVRALEARDVDALAAAIRQGAPVGWMAKELLARSFEKSPDRWWTLEFGARAKGRQPAAKGVWSRRDLTLIAEMEAQYSERKNVESAANYMCNKHGLSRSTILALWSKWRRRLKVRDT